MSKYHGWTPKTTLIFSWLSGKILKKSKKSFLEWKEKQVWELIKLVFAKKSLLKWLWKSWYTRIYYSLFDKQISAKDSDGVKHVLEKSWFNRGSIIMVQGFRSGDNFIPKKYGSNSGHQLYKVTAINPDGTLEFQGERYQGTYEDE